MLVGGVIERVCEEETLWWLSEKLSESRPSVRTDQDLAFVIVVYVLKDRKKYLETLEDVSKVYAPSIVGYSSFQAPLYPSLIKIILKSVDKLQSDLLLICT